MTTAPAIDLLGIAELLETKHLADGDVRTDGYWKTQIRPVTRPFLAQIAERLGASAKYFTGGTASFRRSQYDFVSFGGSEVVPRAIVMIGVADDRESDLERSLVWGLDLWVKPSLASAARERLERDVPARFAVRHINSYKAIQWPGSHQVIAYQSLTATELKSNDPAAVIDRIVSDLRELLPFTVVAPPDQPPLPPLPLDGSTAAGQCARWLRAEHGLLFTPLQIATYVTALQAKGFVILSGLSGTGKTQLAMRLAELLNGEPPDVTPVRPDWRDSHSLLGYHNPLSGKYASTALLRQLLPARVRSSEGPIDQAFVRELIAKNHAATETEDDDVALRFVILDEMNLARVEYYFAEFLSAMESKAPIPLHEHPGGIDDGHGSLVPPSVRLPANLFVVGTVNTDETTHAFSPKVLDRAFTIEFSEIELFPSPALAEPKGDVAALRETLLRSLLVDEVSRKAAEQRAWEWPRLIDWLRGLHGVLEPLDLHFGYRVRDEVARFVGFALESPLRDGFGASDQAVFRSAFDQAVMMKVLPKLHGPRGKLERPLVRVLAWAASPDAATDAVPGIEQHLMGHEAVTISSLLAAAAPSGAPALPATARKSARMLAQVVNEGFAAFA